jgi:hypothetical protein
MPDPAEWNFRMVIPGSVRLTGITIRLHCALNRQATKLSKNAMGSFMQYRCFGKTTKAEDVRIQVISQ